MAKTTKNNKNSDANELLEALTILEKEKNIIWILWLTNYRDIGNNVNWYIY